MKKQTKIIQFVKKLQEVKDFIPILRKLQEEYRGIQSLYPQYRGKEYASVFYKEGNLEYLDAVAFINFLELLIKEVK